jgi:hypothetical protein
MQVNRGVSRVYRYGRPIFAVLGFILSPLTGCLNRYFARRYETRLRRDIQDQLLFLFTKHGGRIVPNLAGEDPARYNYVGIFVKVAVDNLLIRFWQSRGEVGVQIAAKDAPGEWYDLPLLLRVVAEKSEGLRRAVVDLRGAAELLEPTLDRLKRAFDGADARNALKCGSPTTASPYGRRKGSSIKGSGELAPHVSPTPAALGQEDFLQRCHFGGGSSGRPPATKRPPSRAGFTAFGCNDAYDIVLGLGRVATVGDGRRGRTGPCFAAVS